MFFSVNYKQLAKMFFIQHLQYTDISSKEQRWSKILYNVENIKSVTDVNAIKYILLRFNHSLEHYRW